MFRHILIITLRNITNNKVITLINITGLAIGIAMVLLIYNYTENEYRYDQHVEKKDRIYRLERWNTGSMPSLVGYAMIGHTPEVEKATRVYYPADLVCKRGENKITIKNFIWADSAFFDIFDFEFIMGDPQTAISAPLSVVLTESESKKLFGRENPLGQTILCENSFLLTVTGVIKDVEYFHMPFRAVASLITTGDEFLRQYDSWQFPTYVLLPENHSRKKYTEIINKKLEEFGYHDDPFRLRSLNDIYFTRGIDGERVTIHGDKTALNLFITVAVLILVISVFNYINLATARASIRAKEVGVKKVIGSYKNIIVAQFLFESVFIALIALFLGLIIAESMSPFLNNLLSVKLSLKVFYTVKRLVILICGSIILGVLSGLYPALYMNLQTPVPLIKGSIHNRAFPVLLRKMLTFCQFVISMVLIAGTILIYKQLSFIQSRDLGFKKDHMVLLRNNIDIAKKMDFFKSELLKLTTIKAVSFSYTRPGVEWPGWCCVKIDHDMQNNSFQMNSVDPDYIQTMGLELTMGRNFDSDKQTDQRSTYIINESAVSKYKLKNPVGRYLSNTGNGTEGIVIGVVKDFHHRSLHREIETVVFNWDLLSYGFRLINVRIAPKNINQSIEDIEKVWKEICPDFPFEIEFLDQSLELLYKKEKQLNRVIGSFSLLAVFIACLGLFALTSFNAERRTREIGVRKANGAKTEEILVMLSKDFTHLLLIAFVIACPVAYIIMNKWLQNFAYRTGMSWWIFAMAGVIAFMVALLTVSWQSYRAASGNPVEALRYE